MLSQLGRFKQRYIDGDNERRLLSLIFHGIETCHHRNSYMPLKISRCRETRSPTPAGNAKDDRELPDAQL